MLLHADRGENALSHDLTAPPGMPSWLSTHPALDERVPAIRRTTDRIGKTAQ